MQYTHQIRLNSLPFRPAFYKVGMCVLPYKIKGISHTLSRSEGEWYEKFKVGNLTDSQFNINNSAVESILKVKLIQFEGDFHVKSETD